MAVVVIVILLAWKLIPVIIEYCQYAASDYRAQTGLSYIKLVFDKGRYGEYLTGAKLARFGHHRTLYNLYVPKPDGTTSEIDVVFIHASGVYVIESKNYSGAVYGSENDRYWTVALAGGRRKERLYNPIRQNAGHITALVNYLSGLGLPLGIFSVLVFSVRSVLAKVPQPPNVIIVNRNHLVRALKPRIKSPAILTDQQIEEVYAYLQPLTQTSPESRQAHIDQINSRI